MSGNNDEPNALSQFVLVSANNFTQLGFHVYLWGGGGSK